MKPIYKFLSYFESSIREPFRRGKKLVKKIDAAFSRFYYYSPCTNLRIRVRHTTCRWTHDWNRSAGKSLISRGYTRTEVNFLLRVTERRGTRRRHDVAIVISWPRCFSHRAASGGPSPPSHSPLPSPLPEIASSTDTSHDTRVYAHGRDHVRNVSSTRRTFCCFNKTALSSHDKSDTSVEFNEITMKSPLSRPIGYKRTKQQLLKNKIFSIEKSFFSHRFTFHVLHLFLGRE